VLASVTPGPVGLIRPLLNWPLVGVPLNHKDGPAKAEDWGASAAKSADNRTATDFAIGFIFIRDNLP
jgi:hypothetical protein